ncbi:MAG TPA: DUF6786 family protein, partial [Spirochaetia bacterium]|nr:DUF6786 family protein [Spirochaetia bacterium]
PASMDPGNFRPSVKNPSGTGELEDVDNRARTYSCDLSVTSASGTHYLLTLGRSVRLLEAESGRTGAKGICLDIEQRLTNRDPKAAACGLGLWSIVQLPNIYPDSIILAATSSTSGGYSRYFGEVPEGWVERAGSNLIVRPQQGVKFKIGLPAGDCGEYLCSIRRSEEPDRWIVVLKRFGVQPELCYVDKPEGIVEGSNGDAVQIYNAPDRGPEGFSEIECHSPSRRLEPGASLSFRVEISVWKVSGDELRKLLLNSVSSELDSLPLSG